MSIDSASVRKSGWKARLRNDPPLSWNHVIGCDTDQGWGGNTLDGASIPPCCRYPEVFGCGLTGKGISLLVFGCSADVMDGISARTIRLGRAYESFFFFLGPIYVRLGYRTPCSTYAYES